MTLPRGATIGIIGGGQLGRMLAMAAARLGFRTIVLEPQAGCPAAQVTNGHITADYDDAEGLEKLAALCDVITYEFENVPVEAARALAERRPVFPPPLALEVSQDRATEKTWLAKAGLKTADWRTVDSADDLTAALGEFGGKGILKTRRLGYDGKGQVRFRGLASDPATDEAFTACGGVPCILEGLVPFTSEISVIATRSAGGAVECFEPGRNVHENGILARTYVPSGVAVETIENAMAGARALAQSLGYVGTLGLEYFVMDDGSLIANEFAPRVHNSGHWTEAACTVSQFEQHIRAVAGWPPARQLRHSDCLFRNILGSEIDNLAEWAADPSCLVHDYGKAEAKPGRKMGHVTQCLEKDSLETFLKRREG